MSFCRGKRGSPEAVTSHPRPVEQPTYPRDWSLLGPSAHLQPHSWPPWAESPHRSVSLKGVRKARSALRPFWKASPAAHCSGRKGKGLGQHRVGLHGRATDAVVRRLCFPQQGQGAGGERPEGSQQRAGSSSLGERGGTGWGRGLSTILCSTF